MNVFETMKIGEVECANRIGVPAMCTYLCNSKDGVASEDHVAHYTTLAKGKPAFIIQEATAVNAFGYIDEHCLGIYTARQKEGLKRIVDQVHRQGVKFGIQLNHAGMKNEFGNQKYSAMSFDDVIGLDLDQIHQIIKDFESAAITARDLKYDFIEIHAAHGYLINQFLSPLSNQRSDEYQDRMLLLRRICEACIRSFEGAIIVRLSVEEYEEAGLHKEDFAAIVKELEAMGVHAISVSSGGLNKSKINSFPLYQIPLATYIKQQVNIPVMGVGLITSEEQIEDILNKEQCDIVLLGRKLVRDPYFLLKWKDRLNELNLEDIGEILYRSIHK
ncbi:MAG: tRNA-dihydrouridine synthase [Erysipelotrichaceae bacterium]